MINPEGELSNRRVTITLLAIIIIGAVLRFAGLGFQSLWYDELHSIIPTAPENSIASIIEYCKGDQPPAFFLYLHFFFKVFGYSDIIGRAACALVGVVSIPVCYWLAKELSGKEAGLMAALLVSVNYFHIYYSQELRFYTMTFLFSALSYLFFIRAYKTLSIKDFVGYIMATTALLYTHYFGLVIFAIQIVTFIILAIFYKRETKFILYGGLSGILVILMFTPWMPVIISDLGISSFWLKKPGPDFILDYFYSYFGKDLLTTLILVILMILFVRSWKLEKQKVLRVILLIWLIGSYLIPYIKSIVSVPMLHIRYTIIALPAWIMIFALGWNSIQKPKAKNILAIALGVMAVANLIFMRKHYTKITKQQFRETSYAVQEKNRSLLPVFSQYPWHYNYYFSDQAQKVASLPDSLSAESFWLLQVEFFSPEANEEEIRKLSSYQVTEMHSFKDTRAILLTRKQDH
jgi:uncharacterized membrane protein